MAESGDDCGKVRATTSSELFVASPGIAAAAEEHDIMQVFGIAQTGRAYLTTRNADAEWTQWTVA
ncbi:MAG: hypothetical protein GEV28_30450 [Actinophytocola sp.]|uniref:hypothetical protein n=1 Tax=Actinophytocola sp. TaxID=1872138 RepID=UPI00132A4D7A|nr:hypothetical protein [Actinophytocola sp.]MPZ84479.1 hypothetical protein [Actinophytocola sp.]